MIAGLDGPLSNHGVAIILWKISGSQVSITTKWSNIGLPSNAVVQERDLWDV